MQWECGQIIGDGSKNTLNIIECTNGGVDGMHWLELKINNFKYNSSKGVKMGYIEAINLTSISFFLSQSPSASGVERCIVCVCVVMNDAHWFVYAVIAFDYNVLDIHTCMSSRKIFVSHHQLSNALISIILVAVVVRTWVGRMQWSNRGWPVVMLNSANRFPIAGWLYKYCRWSCWSRCTAIAFFIRIFITSKLKQKTKQKKKLKHFRLITENLFTM